MNEVSKDIVVLKYYTTHSSNTLITTEDRIDNAFRRFKRFGIRQLGSPSCCDDCRFTSCWDFGKVTKCTEKNKEE